MPLGQGVGRTRLEVNGGNGGEVYVGKEVMDLEKKREKYTSNCSTTWLIIYTNNTCLNR